jgi:hypothetical protein
MPELAPTDVQQFTNGVLSAAAPETQRMLDAALSAARRDVRWFVSPIVYGDVITLNGTGTDRLRLPTKQVINLDAVTSDGVALDPVNDVLLDCESDNLLILNPSGPAGLGRFSNQVNGITVTMDHGFPEDSSEAPQGYTGLDAADWRQAILSLVVNISQIVAAGRPDSELASKQIDDVVYAWGATQGLASIEHILVQFRLLYKWV